MNEISVRLLGEAERRQAAPFLFRSHQAELLKNGLVLAAYCDGEICGAAGASADADGIQLQSLFVAQPFRRRGAARALLDALERTAQDTGLRRIAVSYSCLPQQAAAIHALFLRSGYLLPEQRETLYRLPLRSLQDSYFATLPLLTNARQAHILPVRHLPAQAAEEYRRYITTDELAYLSPQNAPGKVLPPLCLAYVQDQHIRALLTVCEADGCLHISGAYIEQAVWGRALVALLQTALGTAQTKYPQYETLTVTAATPAGERLIEQLLAGAAPTRYTVYHTAKPLPPSSLPAPPGFDGVLVRCNTLTEALAARDIGSRLVIEDGELPWLELDITKDGYYAELHYDVQDANTYEDFRLSALAAFPTEGLDTAQQEALCARMNQTGDAEALPLETQPPCICLYEEIVEKSEWDSDAAIDGFILPYLEQAARCVQLLADG